MKKIFATIFYPFTWFFRVLNDGIYALKVKIHSMKKPRPIKDEKNINKLKDLLFYSCFIAVPLALFILSNFVISGDGIILAFLKTEDGVTSFAGVENFAQIFHNFKYDPNYMDMLRRSLFIYVVGNVLGSFLPIIFSYYVYKKLFGYKVFKVVLFIPTILSSIITVSMFKILANEAVPAIWMKWFGIRLEPLLSNPNSTFGTVMFYYLWMGFGGGLLTQLAAMNTVDVSVSESARLEGIGFFQELWYVVLPYSYQVIMLGFITGVSGIFTSTINLYAFYGAGAPATVNNLGYYFQVKTLEADFPQYHYLSAWGLFTTAIAMPITLLLRHVIFTYGPSEDTREKKRKIKKA